MEQNLNYYKIFYEVAKAGNISKAAEHLYISQPAVSKSITKLEQTLNHTLFIRSKRGVTLTEEGQTLYSHLEAAFSSIETAEKTLKRIGDFGLGQLRIGASTSLSKHILLPYLQDFIELNPHVKVSIECNPTNETLSLLKEGKIDIGLICDTTLDKGYHFMKLRSIQDTFVATQTYIDNLSLREQDAVSTESNTPKKDKSNHEETSAPAIDDTDKPLPTVAGLIYFNEPTGSYSEDDYHLSSKDILEKANLMLLDQGNISRQYIDEYLKSQNIRPGQVLEINNMDLLIDFASIGMGVACVVREFVSSYIENGQVFEIPLDHNIPKRSVGFVYNEHTLSATARRFIDSCK